MFKKCFQDNIYRGIIDKSLGGAARGIAHIGALKAMEKFDIKPSVILATSAGAIIVAMYTRGLSISEMEDIAEAI
ncbi:MAG: patatin-like phospholipase family protein [FCB group bacterium]|nr:patatin-like phospholipase family protein [FCB group bacterium]